MLDIVYIFYVLGYAIIMLILYACIL